MRTQIYSLRDGTGLTRYIGRTIHPLRRRLNQHCAKAKREQPASMRWMRDMLAIGQQPAIHLIEITDGDGAQQEIKWIAKLRSMGWPLENVMAGGNSGPIGIQFPESVRKRMSASAKKKVFTPEHKSNISKAKTGVMTEAHRLHLDRLHKSRTGTKHTLEHKEKIRAAMTGRVVTWGDKIIIAKGGTATHCPSGHEFNTSNTSVKKNGSRSCRECARIRARARRAGIPFSTKPQTSQNI